MHRAAALAIVLLLAGSAAASATDAPITEIAIAQCHPGLELPRAGRFSPLVAFVLTPDGRVLRATVPALANLTTRPADFESAEIGADAYSMIAHQIESAPFFELSRSQTGDVITDTRGTRISAVRASRRMTWASDAFPSDRDAMITAVVAAVYGSVEDSRLRWVPAAAKANPFALCREPVQMGSPFGN